MSSEYNPHGTWIAAGGAMLGVLRRHRSLGVVLVLALVSSGCAATSFRTLNRLPDESAKRRIVLLTPDVELNILHAGGVQEPQAEWTRNARRYIGENLARRFRNINASMTEGPALDPDVTDDAREVQLLKLHGAVGLAILLHQYPTAYQLPTKAGKFEWSLGPGTSHLKKKYGADYALFVFVRDSYASSGRVAFIILAALLGASVQGGVQLGFASLVDLETGRVVWFNRLARAAGDLRTPAAAEETVTQLLADFPQ
jgi:hypothetical protein